MSAAFGPVTVVGGLSTLPASHRDALTDGAIGKPVTGFVDLAGTDRYDTSVDLAYQAFYAGARTVYLASGVGGADAAATVSLVDGPVLLVPPCGQMPARVKLLLQKIQPHQIVTIGDRGAVCDELLPATFDPQVQVEQEARDIIVGYGVACLLDADGDVDCWSRYPADPQEWIPHGPLTWFNAATGITRLAESAGDVCGFNTAGDVLCWPGHMSPTSGQPEITTVFTAADRIVDYQRVDLHGCGLNLDGHIWCHSDLEKPQVQSVLGTATAIALGGGGGCLMRADQSMWCWDRFEGAAAQPPERLATEFAATEIALSDHGLTARGADGTVAVIPLDRSDERGLRGEATVIGEGTQRLLPGSNGCFVDADGMVDCPLDSTDRRRAYQELSAGGVQALSRDHLGGCLVRSDGTATCRSDETPGTWGALGDGLWAPRYRPAEVLGYGHPFTSHITE